ncbi:DUF1778 domain-containing protein [Granulicella arctica]|uniref:DUF1778 domain-containing protein n=1 Tax=Granulicella arctica TaxID=940613 RepID=UPI0021DF99AD|nr:DUF1778 domain-containing protein [Granulicella arctica]
MPTRKPLGVRATPEQHRLLSEAAAREHRSLSGFVLRAALQVAESQRSAKPRRSREEIMAIVKAAQDEVRKANPDDRDILEELIQERRREAASE